MDSINPQNIPLSFVKQYLRVDHDLDDVEIGLALLSAQTYVKNYIKLEEDQEMDMDLLIPILTLTAHFYESKSAYSKSSEKIDGILHTILNMSRGGIL